MERFGDRIITDPDEKLNEGLSMFDSAASKISLRVVAIHHERSIPSSN